MNHVSVSPTDGNGPTQGQGKALTRLDSLRTLLKQDLPITNLLLTTPRDSVQGSVSMFGV